MAAEESSKFIEAYPMNSGDGPNSYAKNTTYQRGAVDAAKELINRAIAEKLDIEILLSSNTIHIADLGCSFGPNTFFAVDNILEAVEFKRYYAVGVPGSFYGRIFPNASIHFFHSSTAIHWLSRVPKEVVDKNSPAWNKGRIHCSNSTGEVVRAYEAQFGEDMGCFLHARAQEIVFGGLIVLIIPGRPNGIPHSHSPANVTLQLLGSCLMDLASKGVVPEEKVDSFNIPMYYMSPQEMEGAVEQNGCFSMEGMENLPHVKIDDIASETQVFASHMRAVLEGLIKHQFGEEILNELFDLYHKKLEEHRSIFESEQAVQFLVVLRRKAN